MEVKKYGFRNWALYDDNGELICVTVYKRGALEVARRLGDEAILLQETQKKTGKTERKFESKEGFNYVY